MSWGAELELEWGGYSRVEHVERVENAEPRQICRGSKARLKRTLIWKQPEQLREQLLHGRANLLRLPVVVP